MTLYARSSGQDAAADLREFAFGPSEFAKIASMLYADSGISLSDHKAPLVYGRLVKRLRALGMSSFKDYCALLGDAKGLDERQQMLSALTTNVTSFFREKHHFEYLQQMELPKLVQAVGKNGRIRLWSAGCSKGHEAYSLAMAILSVIPDAADRDIKVLATDIDPAVVDHAREGVYTSEDIAALPPADVSKYFKPIDDAHDRYIIDKRLRSLVAVRELNLMKPWPMKGSFQIIFCRNVAIYFDASTQEKLWSRFISVLSDDGLLCIGHSERLAGAAQKTLVPVGITAYRASRAARP